MTGIGGRSESELIAPLLTAPLGNFPDGRLLNIPARHLAIPNSHKDPIRPFSPAIEGHLIAHRLKQRHELVIAIWPEDQFMQILFGHPGIEAAGPRLERTWNKSR